MVTVGQLLWVWQKKLFPTIFLCVNLVSRLSMIFTPQRRENTASAQKYDFEGQRVSMCFFYISLVPYVTPSCLPKNNEPVKIGPLALGQGPQVRLCWQVLPSFIYPEE